LEREEPEAYRAFAEAGFCLYPSGTTLNFGRAGQRVFWKSRMSISLLVARAMKVPYGIAAQSFDALDWPSDLIYRPLFRQARFVYCRDRDSLEYLKQRNLLNANSGFRPDSTFFFEGRDEGWADTFTQSHGLKSGGFISVIARFAEGGGPISGAVTAERERQHMEKYKRVIEGWIERTGLSVLICPEARAEAPRLREKIFSRLSPSIQKKCVCMDSFWTPEQACSIYRRSRIVLGHMHSMIFALAVGTPVLHIPYSEAGRKAWMIRDVGLGDWLLDIDETPAETILETALTIHQAHDAAKQKVQRARREIERLGLELMAQVKLGWRTA
jgi:polysaccharide pyruvyl transferase WcaK-like protein